MAKKSRKRGGIGQEIWKKAERSPKAGLNWTGNPENSQKESKSGSVLDRKQGK
ncbi:hypothetical protein ACE38V_17585 [Cytobacillus sp. Hz8]|uniref:hypothetical protein n=1 Tax=Cytobacillus sp. Hz8 TaxID=3347168 RepID=UPI0035DC4F7E